MRCLAAAVALALALAGTAACSGDEKGGATPRRSQSQATPQGTPAARLADVTLPDQPGPLVDLITRQVRAAGTVRAENASTTAEGAKKAEEKISAQLRTGTRTPSAQMTIVSQDPADQGTTEAVVLDGTIYTRVDGEEQAPGKPWVRLSRKDAANPELAPFAKMLTGLLDEIDGALAQMSTDTGLALVRNGAFKGAPADESFEGARVRRYTGTTETAKLAGSDRAFDALSKVGMKEVAWVLWVDGKGLPRKFQADYATPQGMKGTHTVTYRRWGEPLIIQAPPAGKVHTIGA